MLLFFFALLTRVFTLTAQKISQMISAIFSKAFAQTAKA